jgi:hypothetical protein
MTNKDNKNNVQYKDFWVAGFRINGRYRKPLTHCSAEMGKSKKEIVLRSISEFLNKQTLKDEQFRRSLAEDDELLNQMYPDNTEKIVNQSSKIILEHLKKCHKEGRTKQLTEFVNLVKKQRRAIFNEEDRAIDQV